MAHSLGHLGGHFVSDHLTTVAAADRTGLDCLGPHLHLVPLPHRAGHGGDEQEPAGWAMRMV